MSTTIPTRFLLLSDIHDFTFPGPPISSLQLPTPAVDVLIHTGDLTMLGTLSSYQKVLTMLSRIPAELKLVIAGNHDLSLDGPYWKITHSRHRSGNPAEHDQAVDIMTGPLAKDAGVTYLTEGIHEFKLKNGARLKVYASPYQPEFFGWAFAYLRHEDRFNAQEQCIVGAKSIAENPMPDWSSEDEGGVDIVMTHGPPAEILDHTVRGASAGCENLLQALARRRPKLAIFGHIHEGYDARVVEWKNRESESTRKLPVIGKASIEKEKMVKNCYAGAITLAEEGGELDKDNEEL